MCSLLRVRVRVSTGLVLPVNSCLRLQSWTRDGKDKRLASNSEFVLVHSVKVYGEVDA